MNPTLYDSDALQRYADRTGIPGRTLRAFRSAYFKRGEDLGFPMPHVPEEVRESLARAFQVDLLELADRQDSALDGASKLLFRRSDGGVLETVVLRFPTGRTSLCVSSQVGCAYGCEFCATGRMPRVSHLTAEEIVHQVLVARQLLRDEGRTLDNIVFMGMGEPLHNREQVSRALSLLTDGRLFNFPPRSLLVSTVGLPDALVQLHREHPRVRLALSLHSSRQEVRERFMPVARKHDLASLREALDRIDPGPKGILIEYLMFDELNDGVDDAKHLAGYLAGLRAHVNLIPFNPIGDHRVEGLRGSPDERFRPFRDVLEAAGFPSTQRYSMGRDIAAACGQLAEARDQRGR